MDKITYLKKAKEKLEREYFEALTDLNRTFKSDNVQIAVYVEKIIFDYLDFKIEGDKQLVLDKYDLKTLLRGKLLMPSVSGANKGYVTQWFIDKCPKCGCYLYYPTNEYNCEQRVVCANCFEERLLENLKAINFPTDSQYRLVNYKFYTKVGNLDREELVEFMQEIGFGKYVNETLKGISKDLKRLELCDVIDEDSKNENKNEDTSARDEVEQTINKLFGNIWDGLYQDEHMNDICQDDNENDDWYDKEFRKHFGGVDED